MCVPRSLPRLDLGQPDTPWACPQTSNWPGEGPCSTAVHHPNEFILWPKEHLSSVWMLFRPEYAGNTVTMESCELKAAWQGHYAAPSTGTVSSETSFLFVCLFKATPWGLWDLSSLTRYWTQGPRNPAVKAPSPNHWTTRELFRDLTWNSDFDSEGLWLYVK